MSIAKLFPQMKAAGSPEAVMNFNQIVPFQRSTGLVNGDRLGWVVAINGDGTVCAMGTQYSGSGRGQVQIYEKIAGVWTYMATIFPVMVGAASFANSIDMDEAGKTIVIGSPGDNQLGSFTGAMYIFEKIGSTWTQTLKSGFEPVTNGLYPERVRISPDGKFVCGTTFRWNGNRGASTFWRKNESGTWTWSGDIRGAISGQMLGNYTDYDNEAARLILSDQTTGNGRARIYTRIGSTYTLEANIDSPSASNLNFGSVVVMNGTGDEVAIREGSVVSGFSGAGRVHIYRRTGTTWAPVQILTSPLPGTNFQFGHNLEYAKKGNRLAIMESPNVPSNKVGKAHVFKKVAGVWQWEGAFQTPNTTAVNNEQLSGFMRFAEQGGHLALGGYNTLTGIGFVAG